MALTCPPWVTFYNQILAFVFVQVLDIALIIKDYVESLLAEL